MPAFTLEDTPSEGLFEMVPLDHNSTLPAGTLEVLHNFELPPPVNPVRAQDPRVFRNLQRSVVVADVFENGSRWFRLRRPTSAGQGEIKP